MFPWIGPGRTIATSISRVMQSSWAVTEEASTSAPGSPPGNTPIVSASDIMAVEHRGLSFGRVWKVGKGEEHEKGLFKHRRGAFEIAGLYPQCEHVDLQDLQRLDVHDLSHSMTVRFSMAAFSIGTSSTERAARHDHAAGVLAEVAGESRRAWGRR